VLHVVWRERLFAPAVDRGAAVRDGPANSDHLPLLCDVPALGAVATYNVMTQMRVKADGSSNNGIALVEDDAQYERRLGRLSADLRDLAAMGAAVIVVQEAPVDDRQLALLTSGLPPGWAALRMPTHDTRFAQLVLHATPRVEARAIDPPAGLGAQAGRIQVAALGAGFTAANVHLKFGAPCDEARRALTRRPGSLFIAGEAGSIDPESGDSRCLARTRRPRARTGAHAGAKSAPRE
jgi:hypothetical protein